MPAPKPISRLLLAFAFLTLATATMNEAKAQWLQVNRIKAGVSLGFGGLHTWGKPSFDINWWRFTFRVAPGFKYLGFGATYKLYHFKPIQRKDRVIILSAYYNTDWLFANKAGSELRKDQHLYMLMPGIHVDLNYLGSVYFEVSGGLMYAHERLLTQNREFISAHDHFLPMGEIRLGGIFLSRHEYHQDFPHIVKHPPVRRILKRKIEFKK
jgi:hypothetical protein